MHLQRLSGSLLKKIFRYIVKPEEDLGAFRWSLDRKRVIVRATYFQLE